MPFLPRPRPLNQEEVSTANKFKMETSFQIKIFPGRWRSRAPESATQIWKLRLPVFVDVSVQDIERIPEESILTNRLVSEIPAEMAE